MNDTATRDDVQRDAHFASSAANQSGVSVPGVIAAAIWAVGLVAAVIALATGHGAVATVILLVAVMSPWLGLAWVSRGRSGDWQSQGSAAPSDCRELQFTAP